MHTEIAPGVLQIDTLLGGWHQVTAGYLVTGDAPVLVETGSQSSVPHLLAALDELGVAPGDLAGVAVTHIPLDHAGGVGDVAAAFPQATVYVHQRGARHLVDPAKLVNSAAMVYGELLDSLHGRLTPTPPARGAPPAGSRQAGQARGHGLRGPARLAVRAAAPHARRAGPRAGGRRAARRGGQPHADRGRLPGGG